MGAKKFVEPDEKRIGAIHPGEFLAEMLEGLGVSAYALAKAMGKAPIQVSRILAGKSSVTADMARRLGGVLGTSPELWMNLQSLYDLEMSRQDNPVLDVTPIVTKNDQAFA